LDLAVPKTSGVHLDELLGRDPVSTRTKLFGTDKVATINGQRVRPGTNGKRPQNYQKAGQYYQFDEAHLCKKLENITDPMQRSKITKDVMELRQKYPQGVPFSGTGHPDFSRHATRKVQIEQAGNHTTDFTDANKVVRSIPGSEGFVKPKNDTWHHHQDKTNMHLVDKKLHNAISHTGGVSEVKASLK
jgi:hypothetical protein